VAPPAAPVALPWTANRPEHVASHHVRAAWAEQQVACAGVGVVQRLVEMPAMQLDTATAEGVLEALVRSCDKTVERNGHMTGGFAHAASTASVRRNYRCTSLRCTAARTTLGPRAMAHDLRRGTHSVSCRCRGKHRSESYAAAAEDRRPVRDEDLPRRGRQGIDEDGPVLGLDGDAADLFAPVLAERGPASERSRRTHAACFSQTETCFVLSLVNGSRFQPLQRSRNAMPAIRAIRSS